MKKLSVILIFSLIISCVCGCTGESSSAVFPTSDSSSSIKSSMPAFPYAGTWTVNAVLYNNSVYLLSDNFSLEDLYDACVITFNEDASFLYINSYFHEGTTREMTNTDGSPIYILTTNSIYTYDFKGTDSYKKESSSGSVKSYLVVPTVLEGKNVLMFGEYNEQEGISPDDIILLFTRSSDNSSPTYNTNPETTSLPAVPFTNKYGTATTKCVKSGCNNYIASSGDTNCCTKHSNNCLNCGCYIDGDAMYCMTCLSGSKKTTPKPTKKPAYSNSSEKCQYKDYYGNVCGASCTDYKNLCNKHFDELYSTYQSLTGG